MRSYDKAKGTSNDSLPFTAPAAPAPVEEPKKKKKFLGLFSADSLPEKTPWE
jgi:hypothetical protein